MASKFQMPQFDMKKIQNFDWRSLKRYTDPQAAEDLNKFLEKMPVNAGNTMLMIAAVVWSVAGAVGLYATVQIQALTEIRAELQEAEALKPIVPTISDNAINPNEVKEFAENITSIYRGIEIKPSGSGIVLTAKSTGDFGQWREAVGHIQNGGSGWRVNVDSLCVGRECNRSPLSASLKINKVEVKTPSF